MQKLIQRKTEQIAAIIEKRCPVVNRIESVEEHLNQLSDVLFALQQECTTQSQKSEDPEVCDRLNQISVTPLQATITTELQKLSKLKKRFARNTSIAS